MTPLSRYLGRYFNPPLVGLLLVLIYSAALVTSIPRIGQLNNAAGVYADIENR